MKNVQDMIEDMQEWPWQSAVDECKSAEDGIVFLGTVFSLLPSGKYYMPWSSNITEAEAEADELFREALEAEAEAHGLLIMSGEGDPCDVFLLDPDHICDDCGELDCYCVERIE